MSQSNDTTPNHDFIHAALHYAPRDMAVGDALALTRGLSTDRDNPTILATLPPRLGPDFDVEVFANTLADGKLIEISLGDTQDQWELDHDGAQRFAAALIEAGTILQTYLNIAGATR